MNIIKKIFSFEWLLIMALIFLLFFLYLQLGFNHWSLVSRVDKPQMASDWDQPISVGLNTNGWESGAYISNDGGALFYTYYPGNLTQDKLTDKLQTDIDVFFSEKPFTKGQRHALSEAKWSEGGVMMSASDIYYMSDRNSLGYYDLYKNGQVVFKTLNKSEQNPHYCAIRAELYFDEGGSIYIYTGDKIKALPNPINNDSQNIQPFLTPDCNEMYFVSNRGDGILKILKSNRLAGDNWSQPETIVSSKYGVGDPSLTADGQTMFFTQILKSAKTELNSDILYAKRLEP